jgi:hypothetical protein
VGEGSKVAELATGISWEFGLYEGLGTSTCDLGVIVLNLLQALVLLGKM